MKTKVWITNGDLGSENNWAFEYDHRSPSGKYWIRKRCAELEAFTGKKARAEIWKDSNGIPLDNPIVLSI